MAAGNDDVSARSSFSGIYGTFAVYFNTLINIIHFFKNKDGYLGTITNYLNVSNKSVEIHYASRHVIYSN